MDFLVHYRRRAWIFPGSAMFPDCRSLAAVLSLQGCIWEANVAVRRQSCISFQFSTRLFNSIAPNVVAKRVCIAFVTVLCQILTNSPPSYPCSLSCRRILFAYGSQTGAAKSIAEVSMRRLNMPHDPSQSEGVKAIAFFPLHALILANTSLCWQIFGAGTGARGKVSGVQGSIVHFE